MRNGEADVEAESMKAAQSMQRNCVKTPPIIKLKK